MKKAAFILTGLALAFVPSFVLADGSQSYTSPGSYNFTVPAYSTLIVTVNGAGGGGEGGYYGLYFGGDTEPGSGSGGGNSSFNGNVMGGGGGGGYDAGNCEYYSDCSDTPANGASGGASGGSSNVTGGGASGGGGGRSYSNPTGGANGGNGGQASITYSSGALTPNSTITVIVGQGGAGGAGAFDPYTGDGVSGGNGSVSISWTSPVAPTCSVSLSPNPSPYSSTGTPVTLTWSSGNASQVYIDNIGWVGTSGSTEVASQSSTDYSCYGYSSSYGDGPWNTNGATLTVTPPSSPSISITANPTSIQVGQSSTITATFAAGSGDSITDDTINIGQTSVIPYSTSTTRTYTFTPSSTGTTTFLPYVMTSYYSTWNTWNNDANVTATNPPPVCSLSASPASITQGENTTLSWSCSSGAPTSCNGTNFNTGGATSGQVSVSPSQATTYSGSCTGPGGTSDFNAGSGEEVTVSCQESWSCNGQTIVQTNPDCSTTDLETCAAPAFCQSGSSECLYPAISENPSGNKSGNLQVVPNLVHAGDTVQVYWNISNAQNCTVTGTNDDSWTDLSSPANGDTSSPINGETTYTLSCTAYGTNPNLTQTQTVNVTPVFEEI